MAPDIFNIFTFLSLSFLLPSSTFAQNQLQSIFSSSQKEIKGKYNYSEEIDAQGREVELFRGFRVLKYPIEQPPEFQTWKYKNEFLARRKLWLRALAFTFSAARILPIGSVLFLKNGIVSNYRKIRGEDSPSEQEVALSPVQLSFQTKQVLMAKFNKILWESRLVVAEANEFGGTFTFESGYGFGTKRSDPFGFWSISFNLGFNRTLKEVFFEVTLEREKLSEVYTFLAEVTVIGTRFGAYATSVEASQAGEDKEAEINYSLGMGIFTRGPKFFSANGALPLIGALSWPPAGISAGYLYKTDWIRKSLWRKSASKAKFQSWYQDLRSDTVSACKYLF